jgi:hypothetical protein
MQTSADSRHVSKNRLEGSIADASVDQVLKACHDRLITGTLRVAAMGKQGTVELRAGAVETAEFGEESGGEALRSMRRLRNGEFELTQKLPNLSGMLGDAAQFEGEFTDVPLIEIMRHCEDNALSCTITVIHEFDRAEIHYRAGEIQKVVFNGQRDDDRLFELVRYTRARFRVAAPPLDLDIIGWPSIDREPTAPFKLRGVEHSVFDVRAEEKVKPAEAKAATEPAAAAAPNSERAPQPAPESAPVVAAVAENKPSRSERRERKERRKKRRAEQKLVRKATPNPGNGVAADAPASAPPMAPEALRLASDAAAASAPTGSPIRAETPLAAETPRASESVPVAPVADDREQPPKRGAVATRKAAPLAPIRNRLVRPAKTVPPTQTQPGRLDHRYANAIVVGGVGILALAWILIIVRLFVQ